MNHQNVKKFVGITLLASAVAAWYFYGSKRATLHRGKMKSWMHTMWADVLERLEKMKDVTEETYEKAVEEIKANYKGLKNVEPDELEKLTQDMKRRWRSVRKQFEAGRETYKK